MTDFASAVDAYREALARFDAPPAPEQPRTARLVDAGQLLEQMALARETAMAASTSKARQATRPVESLAPRPYRRNVTTVQCTSVEDALRRLGTATEREIGAAAGVSHNTVAERLRKMESEGTARRAGGGETGGTGGGRVPLTWEAAEGPREVEMPKGKKVTEAEMTAVLERDEGQTREALAKRLGCGDVAVGGLLRRMEAKGQVKSDGKRPAGWTYVSRAHPATEASPPLKFAPLSQIDKGPGAEGKFAVVGVGIPLAAELGRLAEAIEREAKRRAAVSLRAEADRLDAEAAGG